MSGVLLTDPEWDGLVDEPHVLFKVYVFLRRRMDFKTGITSGVSEQDIRDVMRVGSVAGRHKDRVVTGPDVTRQQVRGAVQRLVALGYLRPLPDRGPMIFELPHGVGVIASKTRTNRGPTEDQPREQPREQPDFDADVSEAERIISEAQTAGPTEAATVLHCNENQRSNPYQGSFAKHEKTHTPEPLSSSSRTRENLHENFYGELRARDMTIWTACGELVRVLKKDVSVTSSSPLLHGWVRDKIGLELLLEAVERAKPYHPGPGRIKPGYIDKTVRNLIAEQKKAPASASDTGRGPTQQQPLGGRHEPRKNTAIPRNGADYAGCATPLEDIPWLGDDV